MEFRIIENQDATFTIASRSGQLIRTNNEGRVFVTADRALADEAVAYLNGPKRRANGKPRGSHRMKSMFGGVA